MTVRPFVGAASCCQMRGTTLRDRFVSTVLHQLPVHLLAIACAVFGTTSCSENQLAAQEKTSPDAVPGAGLQETVNTAQTSAPEYLDLLKGELGATWRHYAAAENTALGSVWKTVRESAESEP
ncbi:MAG: hypothetical protein KDA85_11385, partial [Planctomycetaceae bacterium]|nr:hypothetical protein [Planctomycetaceae bacterium]